ncbi:glycosyltransferase [Pedobacter sp. HMF7647]|uniref:Glycosyltransferase n=1 Tax=Hufsiella arboris TaxID=2695275 RepID=A0A7K1YDB2_9SPHI|nr:glycosyltransferase [Hufsiella arboris]
MRPRIFTWHIHGSYLYYLSKGNYDIYIPVKEEKSEGYYGRGETFPFGDNVHEVPVEKINDLDFDCILFQSKKNYLHDQHEILSEEKRQLPKIYLEHDPPWQHPTDARHVVDDPEVLIVHVTHFNSLMWDNNNSPFKVIEHGVTEPQAKYTGELEKGIVVINNLPTRGRLLGLDIFLEVRKHIPLDLVGMGTEDLGLGEVLHPQLPDFISKYRFFFNPIRYTSHGLAVCEALMLGIPVIGMATTEMPMVISNDINGYVHTDIQKLVQKMKELLQSRQMATELGAGGRKTALERFNIQRFANDWEETIKHVIATFRPMLFSN